MSEKVEQTFQENLKACSRISYFLPLKVGILVPSNSGTRGLGVAELANVLFVQQLRIPTESHSMSWAPVGTFKGERRNMMLNTDLVLITIGWNKRGGVGGENLGR